MSNDSLRSGELARLTAVSADTLRHYEKLGILARSQRTASGYRMFPRSAVERVQLAQRALQLGFSLHKLPRSYAPATTVVLPVIACSI